MPEDQLRGEKFEKAKKMLNGPYRVALAHAGYVDAGKPPIFVSHGTRDGVLPIERCSRRIVPQLDREGYKVRYREFDADLDSRSVSAR